MCRNPDASDCFILDPDFPALLETRWQGWYAFAASSFHSGHTNAIPVLGGPPVYPYAQARIWLSQLRRCVRAAGSDRAERAAGGVHSRARHPA